MHLWNFRLLRGGGGGAYCYTPGLAVVKYQAVQINYLHFLDINILYEHVYRY